jgi:hypothetical protein
MVASYLECAEWADLREEDAETLEHSIAPTWAPETIEQAVRVCRDFEKLAADALAKLPESFDAHSIGHDLWLTRNGHGAGFWDRGLGKLGDELSEWAHSFGSAYVYYDADTETLSIDD